MLLGAPGIAPRSDRTLLGAPGIATRSDRTLPGARYYGLVASLLGVIGRY